jgi:mRNA-degrading endonuclease RelE of RelBE toxin-antitoxin system
VNITKSLDLLQAHKLLSRILRAGGVSWSQHAIDEMREDDLGETDIVNTLRCGVVGRGEYKGRYRVETDRVGVVVAFQSEAEVVIVTAWRKRARGR